MSKKQRKKPSKPIKEAQEDFWDLGDDDIDTDLEDTEEEKKPLTHKKKTEDKAEEKEKTEDKPLPKKDSPSKKTAKKNGNQKTKGKDKDLKPDEKDLEIDDKDLDTKSPDPAQKAYKTSDSTKTEIKSVTKKEAGSRESPKEVIPTTILEKISLLIVVTCLLGALGWGLSAFLRDAPQGDIIPFKENYPAKGDIVTVDSVSTWWKKPVRSGENADVGVILESSLIPCAKITLSESGSTTLRVTFRNGERQLIGDTINLIVEDGKFARNGSPTIEIFSTAGFTNASQINSYANGDIDPWSLSITESDVGNDSEPLVKARISASSNAK